MKTNLLAVATTAFLHLKGLDGVLLYEGGEPVGIDLFGPGSPEQARVADRESARYESRRRDNDGEFSIAPVDERRRNAAEDLAILTAGFRHLEHDDADGKALAGTALYQAVYADPTLGWITAQASKFIGDWGKFKPGATGN